ncbi:MAG TPA: universal stress protein [Deltaproteobacteria bacterium]|nr:MAG: hypothetical protein DRG83_04580 [Deltaproteobacteria bacterium]HEC32388.1 universal stress protein [Deltaproteobacteria bacterium]
MKVLVAIDRSPESQIALRYVCHLVEHFDATVDALHVKQDVTQLVLEDFDVPFLKKEDIAEKVEKETKEVEENIIESCQVCLAGKVPCEPKIVVGEPAEEILRVAREGNYDLIVLGSHGHSALAGFLLGTIHTKILHYARRPILIARSYRTIQKVLVAYRGTKCDQAALHFIAPLLARKKPQITVLHVQETELGESKEFAEACLLYSDNVLKSFDHAPIMKHAEGDFVRETLNEILANDYDLLVLGAYGHQRSKIFKVISDEALTLVSRTTTPVLVYRNKDEKTE